MTPNPWQGAYHEAAALARTQPAALQTPFQQVMHRTGSLQVEAVKEVEALLRCSDCGSLQETTGVTNH